jgi:hypothetical protein
MWGCNFQKIAFEGNYGGGFPPGSVNVIAKFKPTLILFIFNYYISIKIDVVICSQTLLQSHSKD